MVGFPEHLPYYGPTWIQILRNGAERQCGNVYRGAGHEYEIVPPEPDDVEPELADVDARQEDARRDDASDQSSDDEERGMGQELGLLPRPLDVRPVEDGLWKRA